MRIKNWAEFQHYKDRDPKWIKLYKKLLDDHEWHKLDAQSSKILVMLWLLASEENGNLPSLAEIAFRLRLSEKLIESTVTKLSHWLEQDASTPLAECAGSAISELEKELEEYKEEKETDTLSRQRDYVAEAISVLEFLNAKTGKQFRPVPSNLDPIVARLKGQSKETEVSVQQCKSLIAKKAREWLNDEKMVKYLRPETLFNRTKFESYLGELIPCAAQNVTPPLTPMLPDALAVGGHLRSL